MSEQTPNSPDNIQDSSIPEGEPSMEDILASIRKIISDDEPVALESPEDVSYDLQSDAEIEQTLVDEDIMSVFDEPIVSHEVSEDMVDLDIEAVLAEMEDSPASAADPIIESVEIEPVEIETAEPVSLDADDDVFDLLDMDIPMELDAPIEATTAIGASAASFTLLGNTEIPETSELDLPKVEVSEIEFASEDEMDAVLDDILEMSGEDDVADLSPASVSTDPDLELVKSLMADLADDVGSDPDSHEELDALLAIPEIEPEVDVADLEHFEAEASDETDEIDTVELEAEEPEEDILGDILDMTLEDELDAHPDDLMLSDFEAETVTSDTIAADELENLDVNDVAEQFETADSATELPSLADIAAAAEADAAAAENAAIIAPNPVASFTGLAAAGAGLAALGTTAVSDEPAEIDAAIIAEIDAPIDDQPELLQTLTPEISEPTPMTQEPSMPVQAVNTDTILDDVTESAAAGAFAELNTVVEEKAVFNERGPRIGDLVQEALRPMLKEWLDTNLKGIVERAVAKEVKRISSGK